ncbi:hypothetical protein CORC01_03191 [Colletotrichum orchidophilum]|uniref:Extracellular mutant protein 11 C-terminal domain-containing protein n=1 Tax=Colletotrichum orchidophilum TaxID=1209926 RepID=A0A1G4BJB4_9PEZI|nr:uncharacterized protein CORC01_03191 [Colletotrichum orchidophilum]OHF01435.1 hypothetical protein CORC01_03191 [Colletotrichum orchidophilum]
MPPSSGTNRMAQYARNASMDSAPISNGNNSQPNKQPAEPTGFPTRQAITESARLPAPKPLASAISLASHIRQSERPGLAQPPSAPMQSRQQLPGSSPPAKPRKRSNSQSSDGPGFWPESHIDSQFGSPTTQRTERYDAGIDDRLGSLPPSLQAAAEAPAMPKFENMQQAMDDGAMPFIIGKDGSMRLLPKNQGHGLPITRGGTLHSRVEQQPEQDAYSSEPIYNSPSQRQTRVAIHATAVKRPYGPSAFEDDEEVFSDSPTRKVPQRQQNLRRIVRRDRAPESWRAELFPEEEEVEGSLASDYPITEDDHGTPRASRKKSVLMEAALLESSLPAAARSQQSKSRKRGRDKCDYADDELQGMTYSHLREQPFDEDPAKTSLPTATPLNGDSLSVKLEHYKGQRESDQRHFFSQMTVGDWERSGDWFLDQFGLVTQKLKEARKEKRDMVDCFETEIANREEAVRVRTENITKKLSKIRHKGEDMLADKEV